jgi:spermidine synthase
MKKFIGKVFPSVTYGITQTPTYPCGSLGFFLATKNGTPFPKTPVREVTAELQNQLKYYSKDMHTAMFVLPHFAAKALDL